MRKVIFTELNPDLKLNVVIGELEFEDTDTLEKIHTESKKYKEMLIKLKSIMISYMVKDKGGILLKSVKQISLV